MACEGCPNMFQGLTEIGMVRPAQARVRVRGLGLVLALRTPDGSVGVAEMNRRELAARYLNLAVRISVCPGPIAAEEAKALGDPTLVGACRPLAAEVKDPRSSELVGTYFAQVIEWR